MPESVSADQCEERRRHCQEAMARSIRRIEDGQAAFFDRFNAKFDEKFLLVGGQMADTRVTLESVKSRAEANTHRLNWWEKLLGGVLIGLLVLALTGGVIAYVRFGG